MNNGPDAFQAHLEQVAPNQAQRNAVRNAGTSREQTGAKKVPMSGHTLVIGSVVLLGVGFYFWKRRKA